MSYVEQYAPRRVPKLAVRNRGPIDAAAVSPSTTTHTSPNLSLFPVVYDARRPIQQSQSVQQSHTTPHVQETHSTADRSAKKNGKSMLSFLTLKEPSTSAWADYAAQQKKAAARKSTAGLPVTVSGVSGRKLPEHVPRVNSKWDGLPQSTASAERSSHERTRKDGRHSALSNKPSIISSHSSKSSSSTSTGSSARTVQRPQSPALPTDIHPALRTSKTTNPSPTNPSVDPPTFTASYRIRPLPDLNIHDLPNLIHNDSSSVVISSNELSPLTPPVELCGICSPLSLNDEQTNFAACASIKEDTIITCRVISSVGAARDVTPWVTAGPPTSSRVDKEHVKPRASARHPVAAYDSMTRRLSMKRLTGKK